MTLLFFQFDFEAETCNNQPSNSAYYTDELPGDFQNGNAQNKLSMLNVNIRSLCKNFDSLKDFMHCTQTNFDIIGLVETWFKDVPQDYFNLSGYNLEFQNRIGKNGGGVCLYIKDDLKYHVRSDLQEIKCPENVESMFIEIERSASKNIVVGVVYRPPDQDINVFNNYIDNVLTSAAKNQKLIYLMGDFNINLLNEDVHLPTSEFINVITTHSLYPSITKPTRITSKSATLIDNIFTNSRHSQTSGIIMTDLSDHLPIFVFTDLTVCKSVKCNDDIYVRQYTHANIESLKKELSSVDWKILCNSQNVNHSYSKFTEMFNTLLDKCVPLKKKSNQSRKQNPNSPWISHALLKSIRRKNVLYKKSLKNPNDSNVQKYKLYKNRLNSVLRMAKKQYYSDILEMEKNNMRNTWKVINSIIRTNTKTCTEKFVSGNKTYTCPNEIASQFNKYFAGIGPKLASTIQHTGKEFSSYLKESNNSTFFLKPTNTDEISKIINGRK